MTTGIQSGSNDAVTVRAVHASTKRGLGTPLRRLLSTSFGLWGVASLLAVGLAPLQTWTAIIAALSGGVVVGIAGLRAQWIAPVVVPSQLGARLRSLACWVDAHELWLLLASAPLFLFPTTALRGVIALIPLLWIARWHARGYITRPSPMNVPVLGLLLMAGPSFVGAADLNLAVPKLFGFLFGIGLFYAVLNKRGIAFDWVLSKALVGLLIGVCLVGVLGTEWTSGKLSWYGSLYEQLPRFIHNIPRSASGGINANELAGTLCWLLPFALTVWVDTRRLARGRASRPWYQQAVWQTALLGSIGFGTLVLFLSQSRGAIVAVTLSTLLLLALTAPRLFLVLAAGMVGVLASIVWLNPTQWASWMLSQPAGSAAVNVSLTGRVLLWQAAANLIGNHPLGIGLASFDDAARVNLTEVPTSMYPAIIAHAHHAHNVFLQAALDFGLPGLVAYAALPVMALGIVLGLGRRQTPAAALARACGMGLLAFHIFGLTDAIVLGAKPSFIFWLLLGLMARLYSQDNQST